MADDKYEYVSRLKAWSVEHKWILKTTIVGIVSIVLFAVGISLMNKPDIKTEFPIDYTNCSPNSSNLTCADKEQINPDELCVCDLDVYLPDDMPSPVNIYYELDTFDQRPLENSRDDAQFSGNLSLTPSEKCKPYDQHDGKPIAPCGALADAMFSDVIVRMLEGYEIKIPSGVLSPEEKKSFHNPPDLSVLETKFSKPINWTDWTWFAFTSNSSLNESIAFESERFIGWMHTEWKRKPYGVIAEGLPRGKHQFKIYIYMSFSAYNGTRKFVLVSSKPSGVYPAGVALLVLGLLGFTALGYLVIMWIRSRDSKSHQHETEHMNENGN